uniref:C2H2-type domain-containing protein n=1 Tax=Trichobilharzia regenti TaxID=157069 RepID=A0AA85K6S2_TRIRE|nr:unnamed protein product [Trichobilharzia regenti]
MSSTQNSWKSMKSEGAILTRLLHSPSNYLHHQVVDNDEIVIVQPTDREEDGRRGEEEEEREKQTSITIEVGEDVGEELTDEDGEMITIQPSPSISSTNSTSTSHLVNTLVNSTLNEIPVRFLTTQSSSKPVNILPVNDTSQTLSTSTRGRGAPPPSLSFRPILPAESTRSTSLRNPCIVSNSTLPTLWLRSSDTNTTIGITVPGGVRSHTDLTSVLAQSAAVMNCSTRNIINRSPGAICCTPSVPENTTDDNSGNNAINNTAPGIISCDSNSSGSSGVCVDGGIKIPTTSVLPNLSRESSGGDYLILDVNTNTQQTLNGIPHPGASFNTKSVNELHRYQCAYPDCVEVYSNVHRQKESVEWDNGKRRYVCRERDCGAAFVRFYVAKLHALTHRVDRKISTRLSEYTVYVQHLMNEEFWCGW